MRTLLTLLTDVVRAAAPGPPGLELAPKESILAAALSGYIPDEQRERLCAAVDSCVAGAPGALEQLSDYLAPITARAEVAAQVDRVACGLADVLTIRTLLREPRAQLRLQIERPEIFAVLRYLVLATAGSRAPVVLVGYLAPDQPLSLPALAAGNLLMRRVSVAYTYERPEPLLTLNIDSAGNEVAWEARRRNWPQPIGQSGDIQLWLPSLSGSLTTRLLEEPFTIGGSTAHAELRPIAGLTIYKTHVADEGNRPLAVYLRAYPAAAPLQRD